MPVNVGVDVEAKPVKWHFSIYGETTVSLPFAELVGQTMNDLLESEVDSETAIKNLRQYHMEGCERGYTVEDILRKVCKVFPDFVLAAVLQMLADGKCQGE